VVVVVVRYVIDVSISSARCTTTTTMMAAPLFLM
jgi:hypothetical protein